MCVFGSEDVPIMKDSLGKKKQKNKPVLKGSSAHLIAILGIFLGNIFKYQNDHRDKYGGAILAQQGGFLS